MSEDLSDIINNVKSMVDSGNIPDNIKDMLGNISTNTGNDVNQKKQSSFSSNSSGNNTSYNSNLNIDAQTILKMKSIIEKINQKDDPRANLLYSLKPYLRESRKNKLDQYVNLLNIGKIADIMRNENKEKDNNGYE